MPTRREGAAVWRLVREQSELDLNAGYAYMFLCTRFASTCRVARPPHRPQLEADPLAAALIGLRLPEQPDTYFVWQVAVRDSFRGQGLARALILDVLRAHAPSGVRYVEAHVDPDNAASAALFRGLSRSLDAPVSVTPDFECADYPIEHGSEDLWRIGPFSPSSVRDGQMLVNSR